MATVKEQFESLVFDDRVMKSSLDSKVYASLKKTIKDHKRIIFNGNGYDDACITEATEKRGLCNYRTFTEAELKSRYEITLENYCKTVVIEANTIKI